MRECLPTAKALPRSLKALAVAKRRLERMKNRVFQYIQAFQIKKEEPDKLNNYAKIHRT